MNAQGVTTLFICMAACTVHDALSVLDITTTRLAFPTNRKAGGDYNRPVAPIAAGTSDPAWCGLAKASREKHGRPHKKQRKNATCCFRLARLPESGLRPNCRKQRPETGRTSCKSTPNQPRWTARHVSTCVARLETSCLRCWKPCEKQFSATNLRRDSLKPFVMSPELVEGSNHERHNHPPFDKLRANG